MINTNIIDFKRNMQEYIASCINNNDIVKINNNIGNLIVMSEQEYNGLLETLHLCSIPGMKESIVNGIKTPLAECAKFEW